MPPCKCVLSKDCLLFGNVPVLVKDTTFSCICSGLRTPDWNLECLQECVLSKDYFLFVNQWHHLIFHLRNYFCCGSCNALRTPDWNLECLHEDAF